jgi:hypothetical protein
MYIIAITPVVRSHVQWMHDCSYSRSVCQYSLVGLLNLTARIAASRNSCSTARDAKTKQNNGGEWSRRRKLNNDNVRTEIGRQTGQ